MVVRGWIFTDEIGESTKEMMFRVSIEWSLLPILPFHRVPLHLDNMVKDHWPFLLHQESDLDSDLVSFI